MSSQPACADMPEKPRLGLGPTIGSGAFAVAATEPSAGQCGGPARSLDRALLAHRFTEYRADFRIGLGRQKISETSSIVCCSFRAARLRSAARRVTGHFPMHYQCRSPLTLREFMAYVRTGL